MSSPHSVGVRIIGVPYSAPVETPLACFRAFRCSDDLFDEALGGAESDSRFHGRHGEVTLVFGEELSDRGILGDVGVHEPSDALAYLISREVLQLKASSLGCYSVEQLGQRVAYALRIAFLPRLGDLSDHAVGDEQSGGCHGDLVEVLYAVS